MRTLALIGLGLTLCACAPHTQRAARVVTAAILPPVPPVPKPRLPGAPALSVGQAETLPTVKLQWQEAGTVDIQSSVDLHAWDHWATSTNSETEIAPAAPKQFFSVLASNHITVAWSGSPGATGYRLFVGGSTGNYTNSYEVGPSATYCVPVSPGTTVYLAVTAYNGAQQSRFSDEVIYTAPPTTWTAPVPMRMSR